MVDTETTTHSGFTFSLDKIKNFDVREDDIFILTYAKSGTTWMKQIVSLILNKGDMDAIKAIPMDVRTPYLEFVLSTEDKRTRDVLEYMCVPEDFDVLQMPSPRVFGSHLREEFLPTQIKKKKPKIIYVARNPKDVAVSFHYFANLLVTQGFSTDTTSLDFSESVNDFLEAKGRMQVIAYDGTTWNNHVIPWWNKREEENVLFMKYEDMVKDLTTSVYKVSEFLGVELKPEMVDRICQYCSFESMKKDDTALRSKFCREGLKVNPEGSPYVRKGGIGRWKNYFTVSQSEKFDAKYREWIKNTDLELVFEI